MTMLKENFDSIKNWIRSTRRSVQNSDKPSRRVIMRLPYLEVGAYFPFPVMLYCYYSFNAYCSHKSNWIYKPREN